jgi:hypothetical protein
MAATGIAAGEYVTLGSGRSRRLSRKHESVLLHLKPPRVRALMRVVQAW